MVNIVIDKSHLSFYNKIMHKYDKYVGINLAHIRDSSVDDKLLHVGPSGKYYAPFVLSLRYTWRLVAAGILSI